MGDTHRVPSLIPTGFAGLDELIGGLGKAELVVLAGRPSAGKTTLVLRILTNLAKQGSPSIRILVLSSRLAIHGLALRLLCSAAELPLREVCSGYLDRLDWPRLTKASATFEESGILVQSPAVIEMDRIQAAVRQAKSAHGIRLVVIDRFQDLEFPQAPADRKCQLSLISGGLKSLALELDLPILVLSHLSTRGDPRPSLSDLDEFGSIGQDADVVLLIYRTDQCSLDGGLSELIVAKNRGGPTGVVPLMFNTRTGTFEKFTGV